jgi:glycosyltransferase involved in cell wall biosynthesis
MKVVFIAEQFAPPVFNGSTLIYDLWMRMLSQSDEVYAILFSAEGEPTGETHAELRGLCRDYLILPGHARSRVIKSGRAAARLVNGSLFAPAWLEEVGRGPIQREIAGFLDRHRPDVMVMSKLNPLHLVGERIVRRFPGIRILDLHDDFVARESIERGVLSGLLAEHPELETYPPYRMTRLRQKLSRLDPARARRQERAMLGLFDRVLISSDQEFREYAAAPGLAQACVHAPWPVGGGLAAAPPKTEQSAAAPFDAGFIASDAPFNLEALLFFTRAILPLIRQRRPDFRLLVTGGVTVPCAKLGAPAEGVILERFVDDVATFYERIGVAVVPLLSGTGVSLKTLEALRFGRPVVATRAGARGLDVDALPGLHLANDEAAFAGRVLDLLDGTAPVTPGSTHQADPVTEYYRLFHRVCAEAGPSGADAGSSVGEAASRRPRSAA